MGVARLLKGLGPKTRAAFEEAGLTEREVMEEFIKGNMKLSSLTGVGLLGEDEEDPYGALA